MRIYLCLLFCLSLSCVFHAQQWAPIGSRWIYSYYLATETEPVYDYLWSETVADTLISGNTVRKINFYSNDNVNGNQLLRTEFLYLENNRIYFYKWDQFNLLYDFNLQINDSYTVQSVDEQSTTGLFTCTNKFTFNSKTYFELGASDDLYFGAEVMDWVGSMKDFFPTDQAVFPPEYKRLRCFITADTLYYVEDDWLDFCEHFRTLRVSEIIQNGLQFFPNPVANKSYLSVPVEFGQIKNIFLYNINGLESEKYQLTDREISIRQEDFVPGVYFIQVETEGQNLFGRFVIE